MACAWGGITGGGSSRGLLWSASGSSRPPSCLGGARFGVSLQGFSFLPLASKAFGKGGLVTLPVARSSGRQQSAQPDIPHCLMDEDGHDLSLLQVSDHVTELAGSDGGGRAGRRSVSEPRARLVARRTESLMVEEACRPLAEYMSLPASQYSVLDAERIERIDDYTFRCYVYRFKIFKFEVCPVLLVRVEERPNGCCIRLLSCTLEGSPVAVAQNEKFSASMANEVSWSYSKESSCARQLTSDVTIEVVAEIPPLFRIIPMELIESTGKHALDQLLQLMLPRFLAQVCCLCSAVAPPYTSLGRTTMHGHLVSLLDSLLDQGNFESRELHESGAIL